MCCSSSLYCCTYVYRRPGRDVIRVVTCVASEAQKTDGEEVLRSALRGMVRSMVEAHAHVLVGGWCAECGTHTAVAHARILLHCMCKRVVLNMLYVLQLNMLLYYHK